MPPRPASIKVRALQWLAQREHSPAELRSKLLRLMQTRPRAGAGFHSAKSGSAGRGEFTDPADPLGTVETDVEPDLAEIQRQIDTLIDWLNTQGYLSAQRFVESRIRVRQARYGNLRIQNELRHHGLTLDVDAGQSLKDTELQRALAVLNKKFDEPARDATERVRQMRYLSGRGFSPEVIRRAVRLVGAQPDQAAQETRLDEQ